MTASAGNAYIAFEGDRRAGAGGLRDVARAAREALDRHPDAPILVFDAQSSAPVELDLRGSVEDVLARIPAPSPPADGVSPVTAPRGPGRPKLGVVAREITLLPRHWDWLAQQKGGASVAIRKLVDAARRVNDDGDGIRLGQEAAYRFMAAISGDRPHYEEAIRALFAGDRRRFEKLIADWPADIRDHTAKLAERAFPREIQAASG
jgi:uncharacterized protein